jgi:hypothetical protein
MGDRRCSLVAEVSVKGVALTDYLLQQRRVVVKSPPEEVYQSAERPGICWRGERPGAHYVGISLGRGMESLVVLKVRTNSRNVAAKSVVEMVWKRETAHAHAHAQIDKFALAYMETANLTVYDSRISRWS